MGLSGACRTAREHSSGASARLPPPPYNREGGAKRLCDGALRGRERSDARGRAMRGATPAHRFLLARPTRPCRPTSVNTGRAPRGRWAGLGWAINVYHYYYNFQTVPTKAQRSYSLRCTRAPRVLCPRWALWLLCPRNTDRARGARLLARSALGFMIFLAAAWAGQPTPQPKGTFVFGIPIPIYLWDAKIKLVLESQGQIHLGSPSPHFSFSWYKHDSW